MDARSRRNAINRREFLAKAGSGLAVGAVLPAAGAWTSISDSPITLDLLNARSPFSFPIGAKEKIPIGVFDPVYEHLSLGEMLDKVSVLGLEVMEIGIGGYPNILSIENEDPILIAEAGVERDAYVLKNVRAEILGV